MLKPRFLTVHTLHSGFVPLIAGSSIFPPVDLADRDGLLMIDGDLSTAWLLEAYENGIFPWPIIDNVRTLLTWWSPDPRAILELDDLRVSRRLLRRIKSRRFEVTVNHDFSAVIRKCAEPRGDDGQSWITSDLIDAFCQFHQEGHVHSVEVWEESRLVGGIYGVAIGGFFAGESMFCRVTDASKIALYHLVQRLKSRGFTLFDIQQSTPHMMSLGAIGISRKEFLLRLNAARRLPVSFVD